MSNYSLELTEVEIACGVTLEAVAVELPLGRFVRDGNGFMVGKSAPPALAGAVARAALAGPVEFSHLAFGCPVYVRA